MIIPLVYLLFNGLFVLSGNSDFKTANSLLYKELTKNGKNVVSVTLYGVRNYSLKSELLKSCNSTKNIGC
jgi:hypothetical protein